MSLFWLLFLFGGLCYAQEYETVAAKLEPQEMADLINTIYTDQEKVINFMTAITIALQSVIFSVVNYDLSNSIR